MPGFVAILPQSYARSARQRRLPGWQVQRDIYCRDYDAVIL